MQGGGCGGQIPHNLQCKHSLVDNEHNDHSAASSIYVSIDSEIRTQMAWHALNLQISGNAIVNVAMGQRR